MIAPYLLDRGLFTSQQARAAGVTDFELRQAARAGLLTRLKRGWYTGSRPEWPSDLHRLRVQAELAERTHVRASHYSGAVLLGLPVHRPDWGTVHLMRTGPGAAACRRQVIIHAQVEVSEDLAVPLVIAQTALESPASGLMALDAALARGLASLAEVRQASALLAGHRGHARLDPVLRLGDGRRESPLESRTALVLDAWGFVLEPQFEVPGTSYRADGRLVGTRVLIESDGLGKYAEPAAVVAEKLREDELRARDWQVVRVTDKLLDQPARLMARLRGALLRAGAPWPLDGDGPQA
ncbi:MAG: hypothetical protein QM582_00040 [Micropruina sp.]|uniref:type IV toxin-antitoxin system AbiEi family antitoxin domain-containing protein n=1 Tax=Micropruina sp. TaxID=2737536 RepID=UPI0039E49194